jgi:hypothetical protein
MLAHLCPHSHAGDISSPVSFILILGDISALPSIQLCALHLQKRKITRAQPDDSVKYVSALPCTVTVAPENAVTYVQRRKIAQVLTMLAGAD